MVDAGEGLEGLPPALLLCEALGPLQLQPVASPVFTEFVAQASPPMPSPLGLCSSTLMISRTPLPIHTHDKTEVIMGLFE